MNYLKKLFKSSLIVIIFSILPLIITIITSLIYNISKNDVDYFINDYLPYILLIYYLIAIIFLINKYKIKIRKLSIKKYYNYISLGISISLILNMLIFKINTNTIITNNIPIVLLIISSGLIGPIYEEIIFRYIYLNNLKDFNSPKVSIIINTIVFALIHITPTKIFFAFILGITLNYFYNKTNNLLVPIIIHISANIIALFISTYNFDILILSIILLLLNIKTLCKFPT